MREILIAAGVGGVSLLAQATLEATSSLDSAIREGGVIGVLTLVVGALLLYGTGLKKEHKDELVKKDIKIEALEAKLGELEDKYLNSQVQIADLRRHVLHITPHDIDSTATVRRSTLRLKEQEENG